MILPAKVRISFKEQPKKRKTKKSSIKRELKKSEKSFSFYNKNLQKFFHNLSAGDLILLTAVAMAQFFFVNSSMTSSIFQRLMWPLKIPL